MRLVDGRGSQELEASLGQVRGAVATLPMSGVHVRTSVLVSEFLCWAESPLQPHFPVSLWGMCFYPSVIHLKYSYLVIFFLF